MRQELIHITQEMEQILIKLGQAFRANAYKKAATSLEKMETEITTPSDLDGIPNIGTGIKEKLTEQIDYVEVVETETLESIEFIEDSVVIAAAVRMSKVRLIDNIMILRSDWI